MILFVLQMSPISQLLGHFQHNLLASVPFILNLNTFPPPQIKKNQAKKSVFPKQLIVVLNDSHLKCHISTGFYSQAQLRLRQLDCTFIKV